MTVLEVGPSSVRRLPPGGDPVLDAELAAAAVAGIDDTTVLVNERPVAVESLWRQIVSAGTSERSGSLIILHPSWWPPQRVARILDAAACVSTEVAALPRAALAARHHSDGVATVIELSADVVAICPNSGSVRVVASRADPAVIAAEAAGVDRSGRILIDAPYGVPGAAELATAVRKALLRNGVRATIARIEDAVTSSDVRHPTTEVSVGRPRLPAQALAAVAVAVVFCGVGVATTRPSSGASAVGTRFVSLVEGRVVVHIPAGWSVTRITAGPGSRRVEVGSPVDRSAALHLTQTYTPEEARDRTAHILRQAMDEDRSGAFVDFNAADERAGRVAVTYREIRPGREIRWSVILDGATRISVGCQSAPGREDAVDGPCEEAIRSAREVGGTEHRG